jgi:hypothetical protein
MKTLKYSSCETVVLKESNIFVAYITGHSLNGQDFSKLTSNLGSMFFPTAEIVISTEGLYLVHIHDRQYISYT